MIPTRRMVTRSSVAGLSIPSSSRSHAYGQDMLQQANMIDNQLNALHIGQGADNQLNGAHNVAQGNGENGIERNREEELESLSGSENGQEGGSDVEDDQEDENGRKIKRKRRYHRHTQRQIMTMEAFFKECPHPDDKQRRDLGHELGLKPLQIKFWFQNKRTQLKMQHERHENSQLRVENERLRFDNMRFRDALNNAACPACGGPTAIADLSYEEHQLRIENSRLRDEVERMAAIAANYTGKSLANFMMDAPPVNEQGVAGVLPYGPADMFRVGPAGYQVEKQLIFELAGVAVEELVRMAQVCEPLWLPSPDPNSNCGLVLNEEEYLRVFSCGFGPRLPAFKPEASRAIGIVLMSASNLASILMDVNQWSTAFAGLIAKATIVEVLSPGVGGNYNGAMQAMSAEFQVLSPVVPTREISFIRYSKQHVDGSWVVVDFSPDCLYPHAPSVRYRRRPSGCLIQEMPNGFSKVMWVEHVEVDERGVHNLYKGLVNCGLAYGARRWTSTLEWQCERFTSAMATTFPPNEYSHTEGRRSMMKLTERMVLSFCGGVGATNGHTWTTLAGHGSDDIRVMTRRSINDPGRPTGVVLSAATSFWLPIQPKKVFEFLRSRRFRTEWDILCNGGVVEEIAHISNGREIGNCISLIRVNGVQGDQKNMLIIQESFFDSVTGSFIIYAPVDVHAINMVLGGGDPDYVALLPSGFSIVPDGPHSQQGGSFSGAGGSSSSIGPIGSGGALMTAAFQILVDTSPDARLSVGSVATVNNLISCTVDRLKAALINHRAAMGHLS